MKKAIFVAALNLVATSAFAMKCNSAACESANAVIQVLESNRTPVQVKALLIAVLNGPTQKVNTAILSNEVVDADAGTAIRSILIGVDSLSDSDDGWQSVYEITIKTVGGKVKVVKAELVAG